MSQTNSKKRRTITDDEVAPVANLDTRIDEDVDMKTVVALSANTDDMMVNVQGAMDGAVKGAMDSDVKGDTDSIADDAIVNVQGATKTVVENAMEAAVESVVESVVNGAAKAVDSNKDVAVGVEHHDKGSVIVEVAGTQNVEIDIATNDLAKLMHDPLMLFCGTAGIEVFEGEVDRWFKYAFGNMSAKNMQAMGECLVTLAKLGDAQTASLPVA